MKFTLTIVINKDLTKALVCYHKKFKTYNFIGGKIKYMEDSMDASYRELFEETGITRDDIELKFLEEERTTVRISDNDIDIWDLYITCGILNKDVTLKEEKNKLGWFDILDDSSFIYGCKGEGNCYTYLVRALNLLGLKYDTDEGRWFRHERRKITNQ